jgi:hypothetical protein
VVVAGSFVVDSVELVNKVFEGGISFSDDKRTLPILLSAHVGAFSTFLTIVSY